MNMKWYWGKIALSSLVVFGLGYGVLSIGRATQRSVVRAVETNADLTIPLPFLPFNVDGSKVGTFRRVVLHRSTPERVESVEATVRMTDLALLEKLKGCTVTVDDPSRLSDKSSFRCVVPDSLMTSFGSLIVNTMQDGEWARAAEIPLVLPIDVAHRIQGVEAESHAAELNAERFRELGDSIQTLATGLREAKSDATRQAIEHEMQQLDREMRDLRRSMSEAAAERTAEAAEAEPSVTVDGDKVTVKSVDRVVTVSGEGVRVAPKAAKAPAPPHTPHP